MPHLELLNNSPGEFSCQASEPCSGLDLSCHCSCCDGLHFVVSPCDCYGPGGGLCGTTDRY